MYIGKDENVILWLRFLDDIMGLYTGPPDELMRFVENLNEVHPTIKFTLEHSEESVNFLDTTVHLENGKLWMDLYSEPKDSHSYLHYTSAHPVQCKKSLPYSQLLRVRRICSRQQDFLRHSGMILYHFKARGYPIDLLEQALTRVMALDRKELLKVSEKITTRDDVVALVTTFNPQFTDLNKIVKQNWALLERLSITKTISESKVIVSYKRLKNLRDILVGARLLKLDQNNNGTIRSTFSDRDYQCKKNVSCKSSNLIYCITYRTCKEQYVGQTKNTLMQRFQSVSLSLGRTLARSVSLPRTEDLFSNLPSYIYIYICYA